MKSVSNVECAAAYLVNLSYRRAKTPSMAKAASHTAVRRPVVSPVFIIDYWHPVEFDGSTTTINLCTRLYSPNNCSPVRFPAELSTRTLTSSNLSLLPPFFSDRVGKPMRCCILYQVPGIGHCLLLTAVKLILYLRYQTVYDKHRKQGLSWQGTPNSGDLIL